MLVCVFAMRILAHETAGAARTRSSLRPFGANEFANLGRSVSREGLRSSSSAKADDPVFRDVSNGIENSRRIGYPPEPVIGRAFARPGGGYDGGGWSIVMVVIATKPSRSFPCLSLSPKQKRRHRCLRFLLAIRYQLLAFY